MSRLRTLWTQLGELPALWAVAGFFALALLSHLVLSGAADAVAITALTGALILYCVARPSGGVEVFGFAVAPPAVGTLLHDIAGAPRWLGLLLIPVSLLLARGVDADSREEDEDVRRTAVGGSG
jgi:hypothetical protein